MPGESNPLPTSRVARWFITGGLILLAIALYFRDGRRLPPLTATPVAPAAAATPPAPSAPSAPSAPVTPAERPPR